MIKNLEGISFLTVKEAAEALRISQQTVRKYVKEGRLKGIRVGRPILVQEESIKALLTSSL